MEWSKFNGKICYVELPARDAERSAEFYRSIFGWTIRDRGDGVLAFDSNGDVSGVFDVEKAAVEDPGLIVSIMCEDIEATIALIAGYGCQIVRPLGFHPSEKVAHFRDPGGNVLGLYQEPG